MIRVFKLIIMTFLLSACMIKWEMKLTVNEDLSGAYSLTTGIDEELQIFALEMVESSLGGLENVLNSVPEGYGKSFYSDEIYDGITIRNSFSNIDEFNSQLLELRSNPDTALMLIPIENIKIEKEIQERGVVYKVFGEFAEIIESEVTETDLNIPQMEYLYDLSLVLTLPGNMTSPIEINDGENIVIFEHLFIYDKPLGCIQIDDFLSPITRYWILLVQQYARCANLTFRLERGDAYRR